MQHALRAFTPRDQKAVKAAAETFRQNPKLKVETVLTQLAVGEALVSMLDENGSPQIVERAKIVPPRSQVGAITAGSAKTDHQIPLSSPVTTRKQSIANRLTKYCRLEQGESANGRGSTCGSSRPSRPSEDKAIDAGRKPRERSQRPFNRQSGRAAAARDSPATSMAKSAMRAASSQLGRQARSRNSWRILGGSGSRRR